MESRSARESLDLVAGARAAAADRLVTPWWYHPILGLLAAQLVLGYGLGASAVRAVCLVVYVVGIGVLAQAYKRMTGVWVSGLRPGRARRSAITIGVLIAVTMMAAVVLSHVAGAAWVVLAAACAFAACVGLGRHYDAVLRAELRGER